MFVVLSCVKMVCCEGSGMKLVTMLELLFLVYKIKKNTLRVMKDTQQG